MLFVFTLTTISFQRERKVDSVREIYLSIKNLRNAIQTAWLYCANHESTHEEFLRNANEVEI